MLKIQPLDNLSQATNITLSPTTPPADPQASTKIDCGPDSPSEAEFHEECIPAGGPTTKGHSNLTAPDYLLYFQSRLGFHKLKAGTENSVHCPMPEHGKGHGDKHPSLSVNTETGIWFCHAGCGGGGLIAFEMKFSKCQQKEAWKRIRDVLENHSQSEGAPIWEKMTPASGQPEAIYSYTDALGKPLFQVLRLPNKKFYQRRPDGMDGWIYKTSDIQKVLYHLPDVVSAKYVIVCEGEKDVDNLKAAQHESHEDCAVTTSPGGAGKWLDTFSPYLAGKQVLILPDNDEAGRKHANQIALSIHECAYSVKILELPGLPEKGDVSDFLKEHTAANSPGCK